MDDLFVATRKDIHCAAKQILKTLATMVKKANGPNLKEAQKLPARRVERLDKVFKLLDVPARGKEIRGHRRHHW
jgi:ferritin-like metal-binding protein YciE